MDEQSLPRAVALTLADLRDVWRRLAKEHDLTLYERWVHRQLQMPFINVLNQLGAE